MISYIVGIRPIADNTYNSPRCLILFLMEFDNLINQNLRWLFNSIINLFILGSEFFFTSMQWVSSSFIFVLLCFFVFLFLFLSHYITQAIPKYSNYKTVLIHWHQYTRVFFNLSNIS